MRSQYLENSEHALELERVAPPIERELNTAINQPKKLSWLERYPHQLSGGQLQRVMIAIAISCNPTLLIADEPTTALDVTVQATILELLQELRDRRGMAMIFITHDLGIIAEIADVVAVMYKGKIVESKPILELFQNPTHPYTKSSASLSAATRSEIKNLYRRLEISWKNGCSPRWGESRSLKRPNQFRLAIEPR